MHTLRWEAWRSLIVCQVWAFTLFLPTLAELGTANNRYFSHWTAAALLGVGILAVVVLLTWAVYAMFGGARESAPEPFTNSHGMRLVKVEGGTFRMGSPKDEPGRRPDEGPDHEVTVRGPLIRGSSSHARSIGPATSCGKNATKRA